jgi:hypothetical protein
MRQKQTYTVPEIAVALRVSVGTVRRWIRLGLPSIDDQRPKLVHGASLRQWLLDRREKRTVKCGPRQMYCCKCRDACEMLPGSAVVIHRNAKSASIKGLCIQCGTAMFRHCSKQDAASWIETRGPNTGHQPRLIASANPLVNDAFAEQAKANPG